MAALVNDSRADGRSAHSARTGTVGAPVNDAADDDSVGDDLDEPEPEQSGDDDKARGDSQSPSAQPRPSRKDQSSAASDSDDDIVKPEDLLKKKKTHSPINISDDDEDTAPKVCSYLLFPLLLALTHRANSRKRSLRVVRPSARLKRLRSMPGVQQRPPRYLRRPLPSPRSLLGLITSPKPFSHRAGLVILLPKLSRHLPLPFRTLRPPVDAAALQQSNQSASAMVTSRSACALAWWISSVSMILRAGATSP